MRIDIRPLQRAGYLSTPHKLNLQASNGVTVVMETSPDVVVLHYRQQLHGKDGQHVRKPVTILGTACHYGGSRPWFACPRCSARCAVLYVAGMPACRKCLGLTYPTTVEDGIARSWRKTRKLEARLSGGAERWDGTKPSRMRWATYYRLAATHQREARFRTDWLVAETQQMLGVGLPWDGVERGTQT